MSIEGNTKTNHKVTGLESVGIAECNYESALIGEIQVETVVPDSYTDIHIDPHVGVFASYDYTSKMKADGESISWGDYADYMEVDYNHFDAGMNIGEGVWYDRFNLDLTYQRGFIDTFSDADGFKTSNFMIRLGIAF